MIARLLDIIAIVCLGMLTASFAIYAVDSYLDPKTMLMSFGIFCTIALLLLLILILSCSGKKKSAQTTQVEKIVERDSQQAAQMQAQLEQMRAELDRLKAGQTTQAIPTAPIEEKPESVAAPIPAQETEAVNAIQNEEKGHISSIWKWIITAVVSILFIAFSTRAGILSTTDAYIQKFIAIAAVCFIAARKRTVGIILAILYSVLSACGFLGTLADVVLRSSLFNTSYKIYLYFKTLGSLLAVVPILCFAFVPRRGKRLVGILCGISLAVLVAEVILNLYALGTLSYLAPCVALNYFFCAAAAFAIGERANIEKKVRQILTKSAESLNSVNIGPRSKLVATLLAFFLGTTGAHRYYLGYKKQGIIQSSGFVSLVIGFIIYASSLVSMVSRYGRDSGSSTGTLVIAIIFLLYGAAIAIWAFVDFIRILTGGLLPANGVAYTDNPPARVQAAQSAPSANDGVETLEKLAKLHAQGILTDDEFAAKKKDILEKM